MEVDDPSRKNKASCYFQALSIYKRYQRALVFGSLCCGSGIVVCKLTYDLWRSSHIPTSCQPDIFITGLPELQLWKGLGELHDVPCPDRFVVDLLVKDMSA